jgi:hypothetical protein
MSLGVAGVVLLLTFVLINKGKLPFGKLPKSTEKKH